MELIIPRASYLKMIRYARAVESEISGLADCIRDRRGNFRVGEVYLLKQEASGATVELVEESVHQFLAEQIKKGTTQMPRLWWHSHHNFGTFFSGTDEATIERLKTDTFLVAICVNQAGEMSAKAVITKPRPKVIDPISIRITPPTPSFAPTPEILEEVAEKVHEKKWPTFKFENLWKDEDRNKEAKRDRALWLPLSSRKRKRLVLKKHLNRSFDKKLGEWVYKDKQGNIYRERTPFVFGRGDCD